MIYTALTKKAVKIAFEAHKNQVDKTGMPYICIRCLRSHNGKDLLNLIMPYVTAQFHYG